MNRQIVGFKKIKFYTMENVGAGKLNMPEQEMHTTAFWLHFPAAFLAQFAEYTPTEKQSGIGGLGNALRTVAALLLMCDPRDLGVALSEESGGGQTTFEPNLYLYDMYPGGVGQSAPLYPAGAAAVAADRAVDRGVRLRGRLPLVRGSGRRSGGTGERSGGEDSAGADHGRKSGSRIASRANGQVLGKSDSGQPVSVMASTAACSYASGRFSFRYGCRLGFSARSFARSLRCTRMVNSQLRDRRSG